MEIEHCVNVDWDHHDDNGILSLVKLTHMQSGSSPPYVFKKLSGGSFGRNSWGKLTIELSLFSTCIIGVFGNDNTSINYLATSLLELHHRGRPAVYHVSFVALRDLNAIKEVIICLHVI